MAYDNRNDKMMGNAHMTEGGADGSFFPKEAKTMKLKRCEGIGNGYYPDTQGALYEQQESQVKDADRDRAGYRRRH